MSEPLKSLSILMLCASAEQSELLSALQVGARSLLAAVYDVSNGAMVFKSAAVTDLLSRLVQRSHRLATAPSSLPKSLTSRELDVLAFMANGYSNSDISEKLSLSEATVKSHLYHLYQKLDLRDRSQTVVLAYETGLVRPCSA
ncbi:response regulator transcription factor [Streptomyces sp. C10]|uniref:response regulator transcription factor n=1 Tax=Streptomyces sp. C10 TaxID=531941 RepID=UPI00397F1A2E